MKPKKPEKKEYYGDRICQRCGAEIPYGVSDEKHQCVRTPFHEEEIKELSTHHSAVIAEKDKELTKKLDILIEQHKYYCERIDKAKRLMVIEIEKAIPSDWKILSLNEVAQAIHNAMERKGE